MPFVCETCGKTYKHSGALSKHNDAQHRGIRHKCTKCGALYVRKEDMVKHMKVIEFCLSFTRSFEESVSCRWC